MQPWAKSDLDQMSSIGKSQATRLPESLSEAHRSLKPALSSERLTTEEKDNKEESVHSRSVVRENGLVKIPIVKAPTIYLSMHDGKIE